MKLFCKHNWKEIARTYQPSQIEVLSNAGAKTVYPYQMDTRSYTTILWECTLCNKTKQEQLLGKIT